MVDTLNYSIGNNILDGGALLVISFPIDPIEVPKTPEEFRVQVKNLMASYHAGDIDLLQEIVQNSVDAIEDKFSSDASDPKPRIEIELDSEEGTLAIRDNGPGISTSMLKRLGIPATTNKVGKRKRGHKGVGLTFAAWSSKLFRFATRRLEDHNVISGKLENGIGWIEGTGSKYPKIEEDLSFRPKFLDENQTGSVFEFRLGQDHDLIRLLNRLNSDGIETLLRTYTAIGYVDLNGFHDASYPSWVKSCSITFKRDKQPTKTIRMSYLFPHNNFKGRSFNIDNMSKLSLSELDKLKGKKRCIYSVMNNEQIQKLFSGDDDTSLLKKAKEQNVIVYGAFLDQAATFKELNDSFYVEGSGPGRRRHIVKAGIHFSTVTMPTGQVRDIELAWGTGNKTRLYILVQFDEVCPDLGRKTFESSIVEIAQKVTEEITTKLFVPNRKFLIPRRIPHGETESEREMSLEEEKTLVSSKPDIGLSGIGIVKVPSTEEDVVALFHALLGSDHLKGYKIYSVHGSTRKYDAWFTYSLVRNDGILYPKDILGLPSESFGTHGKVEFPLSVMEFKPLLSHLIDDFETGIKSFEDILVAVAWDKGEAAAFEGASDYVLETMDSTSKEKQFFGETHLLRTHSVSKAVHVLLLKDIVDKIVSTIAGKQ